MLEENKDIRESLNDIEFKDKIVENPNRKKIKIIKQTADEIIADLEDENEPLQDGTVLNANTMNTFNTAIKNSYDTATEAISTANEAYEVASKARDTVFEKVGTKVEVNGEFVDTFSADEKSDRDAKNLELEDINSWRSKLQVKSLPLGMIIQSAVVLNDDGLHLLDGAPLLIGGPYDEFCQWVIKNIDRVPHYEDDGEDVVQNRRTALQKYDDDIKSCFQCGKFVVTDTYVKLPTITRFLEGISTLQDIGNCLTAGIPNITGNVYNLAQYNSSGNGVFQTSSSGESYGKGGTYSTNMCNFSFNAARDNSIYGKSDTVQPCAVRYPYYIVISTTTKTDLQVNLDNVATSLNLCLSTTEIVRYPISTGTTSDGKTWWTIYNDGWKECGAIVETNNSAENTIYYPVSFNNRIYSLTYSYLSNEVRDNPLVVLQSDTNLNLSYFKCRNKAGSNFTGISYEAKGF